MCSLSKEEFLSRAPPFMGDILWAHMEILQKEDRSSANNSLVENNVQSNNAYSESNNYPASSSSMQQQQTSNVTSTTTSTTTYLTNNGQQRTYTQLEPTTSSPSSSSSPPNIRRSTESNNVYMPPPLQRMGNYPQEYAASTTDSSEYSYMGGNEQQQQQPKYNPQMLGANGRVPQYPPPQNFEQQFPGSGEWQCPPVTTAAGSHYPQDPAAAWHQPDFNPAVSTIAGMHHHPAFLQVRTHIYLAFVHARWNVMGQYFLSRCKQKRSWGQ